MFHCFIHYTYLHARFPNVLIEDEFHISAKTEQDIRNMEAVISELFDRLDIKHTSAFMYKPIEEGKK